MIMKANNLQEKKQTTKTRYLITPSLLNSWLYIWEAGKGVVESEKDEICLEDKQEDAMLRAKQDFIDALKKIQKPPNEYMKAGIEFEEECYKGNTCVSPIIEGGAYQIVGTKEVTVDDIDFLMYGRLDVLKGGIIYDIKRIWKYKRPKYYWSSQHRFYMDLFPEATEFQYLAFDGYNLHIEVYFADDCIPTENLISKFIAYLKQENLYEIYTENWKAR